MIKTFLAIMCCKHREEYANAQRDTFLKEMPKEFNYKFFFGNGMSREPLKDEVFVDCDDNYRGLQSKVRLALKWALDSDKEYTHVCKTDDDVYIRPERLWSSGFQDHDYIGRYYGGNFACGLCYWLSARAARLIVDAGEPQMIAEDVWAGSIMEKNGIVCFPDERYRLVMLTRYKCGYTEGVPEYQNDFIAAAEFPGSAMYTPHSIWQKSVEEYNKLLSSVEL